MKNFFNAIGVADMERVHSAMIGWILDDDNDITCRNCTHGSNFSTFPIKERSEILCALFAIIPSKTFKYIHTHQEWNSIDIMIETEDVQGCKEIWVIENKLKSQEHKSNIGQGGMIWQSEKYERIIDNAFNLIPISATHFMLLSLGGDVAMSQSSRWVSYTYDKLQKLLAKYLVCPKNYDTIDEYSRTLEKMIAELNKFLNSSNLSNYSNVFRKLKKEQKKRTNIKNDERYIIDNGLETIFQRLFLKKMISIYILSINKSNVSYDERNGIAMFILERYKITDSKTHNKDWLLQIEFQGGTYKVVLIHKNYITGNLVLSSQIYGKYNSTINDWTGNVYHHFKKFENNGWKVALAKNLTKGKAKPRIALDKKIKGYWYNNQNNAITTFFNEAISIADIIAKQLTHIP